jgi:hypothetical protein
MTYKSTKCIHKKGQISEIIFSGQQPHYRSVLSTKSIQPFVHTFIERDVDKSIRTFFLALLVSHWTCSRPSLSLSFWTLREQFSIFQVYMLVGGGVCELSWLNMCREWKVWCFFVAPCGLWSNGSPVLHISKSWVILFLYFWFSSLWFQTLP